MLGVLGLNMQGEYLLAAQQDSIYSCATGLSFSFSTLCRNSAAAVVIQAG